MEEELRGAQTSETQTQIEAAERRIRERHKKTLADQERAIRTEMRAKHDRILQERDSHAESQHAEAKNEIEELRREIERRGKSGAAMDPKHLAAYMKTRTVAAGGGGGGKKDWKEEEETGGESEYGYEALGGEDGGKSGGIGGAGGGRDPNRPTTVVGLRGTGQRRKEEKPGRAVEELGRQVERLHERADLGREENLRERQRMQEQRGEDRERLRDMMQNVIQRMQGQAVAAPVQQGVQHIPYPVGGGAGIIHTISGGGGAAPRYPTHPGVKVVTKQIINEKVRRRKAATKDSKKRKKVAKSEYGVVKKAVQTRVRKLRATEYKKLSSQIDKMPRSKRKAARKVVKKRLINSKRTCSRE